MKYIGENSIKKLISLIKGDLATKQPTITATGVLERDTDGAINGVETVGATLVETQEATLVDVPNGLLKGDGTTISAAVAGMDYQAPLTEGTDYVNPSQAVRYDTAQSLTDGQKTQARSNIGAAPSGYGFGGEIIPIITVASANETYDTFCARVDDVLATMTDGSVKLVRAYPPQLWGYGRNVCVLYKADANYAGLYTLSCYNRQFYGFRMIKDKTYSSDPAGAWRPLEWVDPPLVEGVEYRTTERYLSKPVYCELVDFGALPNNTQKGTYFSTIDKNIDKVIRWSGVTSNGYVLPGGNLYTGWDEIVVRIVGRRIDVKTTTNESAYTAKFVLWFTKATD